MGLRAVVYQQALATGCVYWSAEFLIQMLWKELPKLYVLDAREISWLLSLGISSIICVNDIYVYCPFYFLIYFYIFFNSRGGGGGGGGVPLAGNSLRAEK